jgi:predicted amidohydrolase YtcJ
MRNFVASLVALMFLAVLPAQAQAPDTILVNGKILTVDNAFATREAIAIHDGRILALGTNAEIRRTATAKTRVIDLQGRTVIPGLIDSHIHAIRAGLSFSTEVNWTGVPSLVEALDRIRQASSTLKPGSWLIVAGGWNPNQFKERRRPTQAELVAAAPNNPVYVQLAYGWVLMTPAGWNALKLSSPSDLPAGATFERDANGNPTGAVNGNQPAIVALFDKLPRPTLAEQIDGTRKFFRELNRLGLTGVADPGGGNFSAADYQAVFDVWRQKQMTVRVTYSLNGQTAGSEIEELQGLARMLPMGFGDEMLRFGGFGERVTMAMYNNDNPSEADKASFYQIAKWAAERGLAMTMHWNNDASLDHLLTLYERLNREVPLTNLRWSIAHLGDASAKNLTRMKALGMGWTVQDTLYLTGDAQRAMPPLMTGRKLGVPIGAGTDAHRVASYNPFTSLQWMLDGRTAAGVALRGLEERPGREDALRFYTIGSAWFSRDEDKRGSLEAGKLADLAVLSKDYMTVPVDQVGTIESLLTMVGGKVVYAADPFKP